MVNGWHNMLRYTPENAGLASRRNGILTFRPLQASALKTWGQGWVLPGESASALYATFHAEHFAQGREAVRGFVTRSYHLIRTFIFHGKRSFKSRQRLV
jgi:hypothetical protein